MSEDNKPKRVPVDFIYEAVNPTFLKWMAKIGAYAADKYGAWDQYKSARLVGEKSPVNHIFEHLRSYQMGERYDHFDGDVRWHLVAVAYNAMMEFYYCSSFGHLAHPLKVEGVDELGDGLAGVASRIRAVFVPSVEVEGSSKRLRRRKR